MGVFDIGASVAGQALGGAMANAQAKDLMAEQTRRAKELGIFNREQQMQLWRDTNYSAQAEQMRKAGLNVGLMYKGAGQGGTTSANAGGMPSASGAYANPMELATQMEANRANIEVAKAQARDLNASAKVKEDTGVDKAKAEIGLLNANTGNAEADTKLKEVNTEIQRINKEIVDEGKAYSVFKIVAEAEKMQGEARSANVKANIDKATQETEIDKVNASYIGLLLNNDLNRQNIKLTTEQIEKVKTEIKTLQQNANTAENTQKATEAFQDAMIKLGIGKLASDTLMGIGSLVTRKPTVINQTKEVNNHW